ncbi:MAG: NTP transferase domain-containing protein [Xanthomonadales bacterium]|nr:NTP transferase domain-containing protein [Xanthomonadales bacterium]
MSGRTIAIIPARGGSKRLPRKNIQPIAGKPMLAWPLDAAMSLPEIGAGNVFVSTEDHEVAEVARIFGAEIIERPAELAGDQIWTEPVIRHAVELVEASSSPVDWVIWMNASVPEIQSADILRCLRLCQQSALREVLTVDRAGRSMSAARVLSRDAVSQRALSVNFAVVQLDYIDIHTQHDLEAAEARIRSRST